MATDTLVGLLMGDTLASGKRAELVRLANAAPHLWAALKSAMPQLEWANLHGSRCEELLAQAKAALALPTAWMGKPAENGKEV